MAERTNHLAPYMRERDGGYAFETDNPIINYIRRFNRGEMTPNAPWPVKALAEGLLTGSMAVRPSGFSLPRNAGPPRSAPTDAQRSELYALDVPHGRPGYGQDASERAWSTPGMQSRAVEFWNAQRAFNQMERPPNNRMDLPSEPAPSLTRPGGPTQGQRDLYSLRPNVRESGRNYDPGRWQSYWDNLYRFDDLQRPPPNRLHSIGPAALLGAGLAWPPPEEY